MRYCSRLNESKRFTRELFKSILVRKRSARRMLLKSMLVFGVMISSGFVSAAEEEIHLISSPVSVDEMAKYLFPEREDCLLYTSPSPRDATLSRMPSSA